MSNRDRLLAAATRCLLEKGYAHTTASEVTKSAGVSLAAIGYHFGSMEALRHAALHHAVTEWGERLEEAIAAAEPDAQLAPLERFALTWTRILRTLDTDGPLWKAQLEMVVEAQHASELRAFLTASATEGRQGLAETFRDVHPDASGREADMLGSLYQALLLGMVTQWLIAPDDVLDGPGLVGAMRLLATGRVDP